MPPRDYRKRYVAFEIEAPRNIQRWELIAVLQNQSQRMNISEDGLRRPWLTAFNDNRGILRCAHTDKESAIELLKSITEVGEDRTKITIRTITTSGTIKKAKSTIEQ